jgi:glucosylceramidase
MKRVSWKCSTVAEPWVDMDCPDLPAGGAGSGACLKIYPEKTFQPILGWGGCFNEKGWEAMAVLAPRERNRLLKSIFDPADGCKFNVCRVPIGSNDYSTDLYSLAEKPGDYGMEHFSIERDRKRLIPYIMAAMKFRPDLRIWGSPWSPPKWLKTTDAYTFGALKQDEESLKAYALYFAKFVKAYRAEGINLFAVMPQNEPCWNNRDYPACGFECGPFVDFVKNHLVPTFEREKTDCDIWIGTMVDSKHGDIRLSFEYISRLLSDASLRGKIAGVGCQYGDELMRQTREAYPSVPLMQTETYCGNASNDWSYARQQFDSVKTYLESGAGYYMLWNMVLDETGRSVAGWPQSAPVTVNSETKAVTYNSQFHMFKHFSGFVAPGGYRIEVSGDWSEALAFRNPDGRIVVVMQNSAEKACAVTVDIGGRRIQPVLRPQSWNTFVCY